MSTESASSRAPRCAFTKTDPASIESDRDVFSLSPPRVSRVRSLYDSPPRPSFSYQELDETEAKIQQDRIEKKGKEEDGDNNSNEALHCDLEKEWKMKSRRPKRKKPSIPLPVPISNKKPRLSKTSHKRKKNDMGEDGSPEPAVYDAKRDPWLLKDMLRARLSDAKKRWTKPSTRVKLVYFREPTWAMDEIFSIDLGTVNFNISRVRCFFDPTQFPPPIAFEVQERCMIDYECASNLHENIEDDKEEEEEEEEKLPPWLASPSSSSSSSQPPKTLLSPFLISHSYTSASPFHTQPAMKNRKTGKCNKTVPIHNNGRKNRKASSRGYSGREEKEEEEEEDNESDAKIPKKIGAELFECAARNAICLRWAACSKRLPILRSLLANRYLDVYIEVQGHKESLSAILGFAIKTSLWNDCLRRFVRDANSKQKWGFEGESATGKTDYAKNKWRSEMALLHYQKFFTACQYAEADATFSVEAIHTSNREVRQIFEREGWNDHDADAALQAFTVMARRVLCVADLHQRRKRGKLRASDETPGFEEDGLEEARRLANFDYTSDYARRNPSPYRAHSNPTFAMRSPIRKRKASSHRGDGSLEMEEKEKKRPKKLAQSKVHFTQIRPSSRISTDVSAA